MSVVPRPLLLALAAGAMLSLGGLGWLARDLAAQPSSDQRHPSLFELLEEVRQPPSAPEPGRRAAPGPPAHTPWRTPLRASCTITDPDQRQRLLARLNQLRTTLARVSIHPSNYGERLVRDAYGNPVNTRPQLVVLHETVYSIDSAINTFITPHPRDADQVSYHALIGGNGSVVQVLDPAKRAYGAGNSAFNGRWVVTNPRVGGSVNNFALHVSLETPVDGEDQQPGHSGYSAAQYDALAALLADWMERFSIPPAHITTHRAVDLGGERADPRSFQWGALQQRLQNLGLLCQS